MRRLSINPKLTITLILLGLFAPCTAAVAQRRQAQAVEELTNTQPLDAQIVRLVAAHLEQYHYSKKRINDEISERAYDLFLRELDPLKQYFLQSDIDALATKRLSFDDFVKQRRGNMDFAIAAFKVFLRRVDERVEMAHNHIDGEHDFTIDEQLPIEREIMSYPASDAEADDRMRRQIKFSLLVLESDRLRAEKEEADGKERTELQQVLNGDPNEDPKERLHRRYRNVQRRWHQTDSDDLLQMFLSSIAMSFDPHSLYWSRSSFETFMISMTLKLEGIGAQLMSEDGYTKLTSIVPGGAADKDGRLKPGDKIVQVGQGEEGSMVDVIDMKLDNVVQLIRGSAGTVVRLAVMPNGGGEQSIVDITRAKISLDDQAARSEVVEFGESANGQPMRFGYIDLPNFYSGGMSEGGRGRSATEDVRAILHEFRRSKVDAVVLDVSRNGGGSLSEAVALTGLFIDQGPVVQVKGYDGQVEVQKDVESGLAWSGPLVIMASQDSASASEILAGAIQDYRRGLVVGDPSTHGKGTVQSLLDLSRQLLGTNNEMGALKLTISQFYLPDGHSTQREALMSDVIVPAISASMDHAEKTLDYALEGDRISPVSHNDYNMVNEQMIADLQSRSKKRVTDSDGFSLLLRRIELFKQQQEEEYVSLNRSEYLKQRAEMDAQREEAEKMLENELPKEDVFRLDFYNREILSVARDYIEALSKLDLAQAG